MTDCEEKICWNVQEVRTHIQRKLELLRNKQQESFDKKRGNFILLLEDILLLEYFAKYPSATTSDLVAWVKSDRKDMLEYAGQKTKELGIKEKKLEEAQRHVLPPWNKDYIIPDEEYDYSLSQKDSIRQIQNDLGALHSCIYEYKRLANQLHRLLGIIRRPDGFFDSVL
jgi:hypothetical protein